MSDNFNWKGKTLNQVISKIRQNKGYINDIYGPTPIKSYRREINTNMDIENATTTGNQRTSVKIDEINRPGGSMVVSSILTEINNAVFIENENNPVEEEKNALLKVRNGKSSLKGEDDETDGEYFADSLQYLKSRGLTFDQNLTYTVKVEKSSAYTNKLKFKTLTETEMTDTNTQNTDLLYAVPVENLKKKGGQPFPMNSREKLKKITGYIDETIPTTVETNTNPIYNYSQTILLNKAFSFNSNDYITANNGGLTICFWIYLINNTGSEWIFNFTGLNNTTELIDLCIKNSNPGIYGEYYNQKTYFPTISYNRWYHIAMTVSQGGSSRVDYFLNGINIGYNSNNLSVGTIDGIATIGNQGIFDNNNIANAKFTDVRLYDTAITVADIRSIYNNGLGTFETILYSNLLYQYRFYDTDYSVVGNERFVNNWGNLQNTTGKIINGINQTVLPRKLFYFDRSILPTVIGNQGMTICFWAKLLTRFGSNYLFYFNGQINNFPVKFSVKIVVPENQYPQLHIEINNSPSSYITIHYDIFYFITVSVYTNVNTGKININFYINDPYAYDFYIPTNIDTGIINGIASLGHYEPNSVLNSANAEYADARLYNTVLSTAEIRMLYNKGIGTYNNIIRATPLYEYIFFTNDYSSQNTGSNQYITNWGSLQDVSGVIFVITENAPYNLLESINVNSLNNNAFSFNGNLPVSFVNTGITVCFWVYSIAMDISYSDWYFYFNGLINGTNAIGFSVKTTNYSLSDPEMYIETNDVSLNFPTTVYGKWNHIAVTGYDNTNNPLNYYFNGQYVGNIQSQYTIGDISGVFQLGNSYSTDVSKNYYANAKYTDVRLYDSVLQLSEIQQVYNSGTGTENQIRSNSILYQYLFKPNDYSITNNITFVNNRATNNIVGTNGMIIPNPPNFEPLFSTGKALFDCKWVNRSYTGPIFKLIDLSANYLLIIDISNNGSNLINIIDPTTNEFEIIGNLQDFYVDTTGSIITTLPNGMGVQLNDWLSLGGTKTYVDIWYDQTGNGNNATTNNPSLYKAHVYYDIDENNELKYIPYLEADPNTSRNMISFNGTRFFTLPNRTVPYGSSSYTVSTILSNIYGRGDFLTSGNYVTNIYNNFSTTTFSLDNYASTNYFSNYWDISYIFKPSYISIHPDPANPDPTKQKLTFIYDGYNVAYIDDNNNNYYKTNVYVDGVLDSGSDVYNNALTTYEEQVKLFTDISGVRMAKSDIGSNELYNFIGARRINASQGGILRLSYYSGNMNYMWISDTVLNETERGIIENLYP